MGRDRKSCVDRLLVGYKRENPDFRYLIRNGENDIKILIKRISEGEKLPYRNLEINVLGRVSPLKTVCKPEVEEEEEQVDTGEDDFQLDTNRRNNRNITAILDGIALQAVNDKKLKEQRRGWD